MNATEDVGWLDMPSVLDATVERLKTVKAVGLNAGLDFHGRLHKPMAKQLAKALEPHRPLFIEEPIGMSISSYVGKGPSSRPFIEIYVLGDMDRCCANSCISLAVSEYIRPIMVSQVVQSTDLGVFFFKWTAC